MGIKGLTDPDKTNMGDFNTQFSSLNRLSNLKSKNKQTKKNFRLKLHHKSNSFNRYVQNIPSLGHKVSLNK